MLFLIIIILILLAYTSIKCFIYYCSLRGVLYYLGTKHNDILELEKVKELTYMAVNRIINEFFGRS